ncbi:MULTISPECIES: glycine cleavage system aminomethyltransferase GcvT [Rhodomicrobium]|uniref:glycine cleavage system aminomethyltransferase GcvT n=1 Tax=Rhodomicrobium TaxID=1068 RepID=UPI000B4BEBE4|nr:MULTISPECIES: glycine cleavage system aminomethyltransferase GcvT [Rhodomicrobium]
MTIAAPEKDTKSALKRTPLHALHLELGAKMVPFGGYDMPVSYPPGLIKEHLHTREAAGLFDVSHMGQCHISSESWDATARAIEALVPADVLGLKPGQQRYSQLMAEDGGILDDLMITRLGYDGLEGTAYVVVNAGCKDADYIHIADRLPDGVTLQVRDDLALIALQGPQAVDVMAALVPDARDMPFMCYIGSSFEGFPLHISRSGYTGEDGYEISVPAAQAEALARALLGNPLVKPIGLGARDTLRLEAGLCLYGHDIDESTSPVEADLVWSIGKRRRDEGGFPGAGRVQAELNGGPSRKRVGLRLEGRAPAREGCEIVTETGEPVGRVTSGSFAPSVGGPVAMGYVAAARAAPGTRLNIVIRGTPHPASVVKMPFVPHRYHRPTKSGKSNG